MRKFKKLCLIIALLVSILGTSVVFADEKNNNVNNGNNNVSTSDNSNELKQEGTATTILKIKDEQLKSLDDYKAKYGSDTYGFAAYVLHLIQVYSIPIGIVGIAICGIYQYIIGLKRLDIRDKGFYTMISMVTILIICQILPLIFAVVIKSND